MKAMTSAQGSTEGLLQVQRHVRKVLALMSVDSSVTEEQLNALQALGRPKQLAEGDLDAHVDKYDFKSENVIELLKQLQMKFEDDKLAGTKAETNAQNSHDQAEEARDNA